MSLPQADDRFWYLSDPSLGNSLSESERRELQALLSDNPGLCKIYCDLSRLHTDLDLVVNSTASLDRVREMLSEGSAEPVVATGAMSLSAAEAAAQTTQAAVGPPNTPPLLGFLNATIRLVPGGEFTVGFLLIVAVVSAFVGLATLVLQTRQDVQQLALDREQKPAAARLTGTEDCVWRSPPPSLGSRVDGKLLQVGTGIAEFTFANAVRVVVEGPATFEVVSAARFRLDRGKLAAAVPRRAVGFTVVTPTAEVIDLGTEFGVEVDGSEQTDVHVLKGEVAVKAKQDATASPDANQPVRLLAGEAVRLSKGLPMARLPADAARFGHVLRPISPPLGKQAASSTPAPPKDSGPAPLSFVEDFQAGNPGPNLALGEKGGAPKVDFSGQNFAITSGENGRIYLGTRSANYASVNFVFEATAIMPTGNSPWSDAFFGLGTSTPSTFFFEPAAPNVLLVVRIDKSPNDFEIRGGKWVNPNSPAPGDGLPPKFSGKTMRLRMTWTAKSQMARFEIDANYAGGPLRPTYSLDIDGSDVEFEQSSSQLVCGGGNALEFDDIRVTVLDESAPAPSRPK